MYVAQYSTKLFLDSEKLTSPLGKAAEAWGGRREVIGREALGATPAREEDAALHCRDAR